MLFNKEYVYYEWTNLILQYHKLKNHTVLVGICQVTYQ